MPSAVPDVSVGLMCLQESELSEDNAPQKPVPVLRAELHHHRRLAHNGGEETGTHLQRFCERFLLFYVQSAAVLVEAWRLTRLLPCRPAVSC